MTVSDSTLRSIALAEPATIRVFESFHLDYCCGGNRPLREACTEKGLEIESVLSALAAATGGAEAEAGDFSNATLAELIGHIVAKHHAYVRGELPRLLPMAEKVAAKHGPKHPEFLQIDQQLRVLAGELTLHLDKEETILFPYIEALERNREGAGERSPCMFWHGGGADPRHDERA